MTEQLYLYGVTAASGSAFLPEVRGLAGNISMLEHDGLCAIAGAMPEGGFQDLSRENAVRLLLGHHEVLEAAMTRAAVLPAKFGTVAPDSASVLSLLRQKRDMLAGTLAGFADCQQMEIAVLWQPETVFGGIATEPAIAEARRDAQGSGDEAAAARLGQLVKAAFESQRAAMQVQIGGALRPVAQDIAFNATMDERMAANIAILIRRCDTGRLEAILGELDADFRGRLTFHCMGPLPPASFATLKITFPSAQAIVGARQCLELTGPLNRKDITSSFHRLAREHHPDLAAPEVRAAGRMEELTQAYWLLLACAKSREPMAAGGEPEEPVLLEITGQKTSDAFEIKKGVA